MSVCCECCVLSGRGLFDGLIPCTQKSYGCLSALSAGCCQVEVCETGKCIYRGIVWMSVCCDFCVLSGGGLCDGLIPCTGKSYGCLCVLNVVCCQVEVCATG